MPSIMERISLIARSEMAELRERYEDPERVINQTIADAMVSYTKLRQELEPVTTAETQARERLEALVDEAERWHRVARKAVAAGNDDDARTALSREYELKERIASRREIYDQAHEVADALRRQLAAIEDGIAQMQAKMARVKGKDAAAQATSVANGVTSGSSALDQLETQADWKLAEAEGLAAARRVAADPLADLEQAPGTTDQVEAELAALRAKLAEET